MQEFGILLLALVAIAASFINRRIGGIIGFVATVALAIWGGIIYGMGGSVAPFGLALPLQGFIVVVVALLLINGIQYALTQPELTRLNSTALTLIPLAIALNIAGGQLIKALRLPVYLDSIGTVLTGALLGPWVGMLTGFLSNAIWTLSGLDGFAFAFALVAGAIGLIAGLAGRYGAFRNASPRWLSAIVGGVFLFALALFVMMFLYPQRAAATANPATDPAFGPNNPGYSTGVLVHSDPNFAVPYLKPGDENYDGGSVLLPQAADLLGFGTGQVVFALATVAGLALGYFVLKNAGYAGLIGLLTGVVAALCSAPIAAALFGGLTGGGTDLLVAAFRQAGANVLQSAFAQGAVSDPFDKMTSFLIVWLIIQSLPNRLLRRFPNARVQTQDMAPSIETVPAR